jgi:hypothetical protein
MQFRLLLIGIFLVASSVTATAQSAVEFSADSIESQPGQDERKGRLYVGKDRIRSDIDMNGEKIIQIIDLAKQEAIVINVAQKSFMRRRASEFEVKSQSSSSADENPCAGMRNLVCKKTGAETVNGRKTLKWEISNPADTQGGIMRFWVDAEHRIPVRQEMPDGSIMEQHLLGRESVNGRNAEKWEMTMSRPDGQSQVSYQWYDPQIKMNVREQLPGGFTRNLINIKLKHQPAELFSIPDGFSEISMPQQPGQ